MKAFILKNNGGIENLVQAEIPIPKIGNKDILVNVKAISINPVDAYVRTSNDGLKTFLGSPENEHLILGWDIAGVVESAGPGCEKFSPGDEVFGLVNFPGHGRGYAEFVSAPEQYFAKKPANVTFTEAAGATLAALTAWQALTTHGNVRAGDRVVVHAAAGGVGHYAIQMAKSLGAHVIAVSSDLNKEFVTSLGADEHYNYSSEEEIKDSDLVIDAIAGDHILTSIQSLKNGGRLVSLLSFIEGRVAEAARLKNIHAVRMIVKSNGSDMDATAGLLANKKVRTHVSHDFIFADLPLAHKQIETRKSRGKVVVHI